MSANAIRGEAEIILNGRTIKVRPSFAALVVAEAETGPLFALAEQAVAGALSLTHCEALLWHCSDHGFEARALFQEAIIEAGLVALMPGVRMILMQILAGR